MLSSTSSSSATLPLSPEPRSVAPENQSRFESSLTPFQEAVQAVSTQANAGFPDWFGAFQKESLKQYFQLGFPTRKQEAWKYIDLKPLQSLTLVTYKGVSTLSPQDEKVLAEDFLQPGESLTSTIIRLVFINGVFSETASHLPAQENLPPGVSISPLSKAFQTHSQELKPYFSASHDDVQAEKDSFIALNGALFTEGVYLHLAKDTVLKEPVQLLFVSKDEDTSPEKTASLASHFSRCLIQLEDHAQGSVFVQHLGLTSSSNAFSSNSSASNLASHHNSVMEIQVGRGAHLEWTVLQSESQNAWNFSATKLQLAQDSVTHLNCLAFGGNTHRHHIDVDLIEPQAACFLNGLSILNGKSQVYRHITVDHLKPHGKSEQVFKGILSDETRSEFDGSIVVHRDAAGTDAIQLNKNLILSSEARVFTRPQLQIDTDDVKCAHGATVGQLAEEELFYLISRGIPPKEARSLLTYGFAEDILNKITQPSVRSYLESQVQSHLSSF
ncbi:MAG: Fe-S cluster assembly protein SufD [Cyanobacteria bacterium]|nr:Fe-S cluster assembly protein SufD [Cyanobacteriota bacterium]